MAQVLFLRDNGRLAFSRIGTMLVFKRINGEKKKLTDIGLIWFSFRTVGPVGFFRIGFLWSFFLDIGLIDY